MDPPFGVGKVCEALSRGSSKMQCGPGSIHGITGNCGRVDESRFSMQMHTGAGSHASMALGWLCSLHVRSCHAGGTIRFTESSPQRRTQFAQAPHLILVKRRVGHDQPHSDRSA